MASDAPRKAPVGSLHRGLVGDGAVRFLAVEARALAEDVRERHHLGPRASRVASEALVAGALMSAWIKGDERITLQIQAREPAFGFAADVDAEGGLRATMNPTELTGPRRDGINGLLLAIKSNARKELYRGVTELSGQTLQQALSDHLGQSDQVDVLVRIGARIGDDGEVRSAAGLVLERLPEEPGQPSMTSADFAKLHDVLLEQPISDLIVALAFGKVAGEPIELLENRVLSWRCGCSQERIEAVLYNLGVTELRAILEEDGHAEVSCHFCNIAYQVDARRLAELIAMHGS